MKKITALILTIVLCGCLAVPAFAEYGNMAIPTWTGAFFLNGAEKGGVRALKANPLNLEHIEIIYVKSGSLCSFGGQDGFAMPPSFLRVNFISDTESVISNPEYCYAPLNEEKYECTVDELFSHCKITKGKALILCAGNEYYMLMINGTSLPDAEEEPEFAIPQKQTITVNDKPFELTAYALQDKTGGLTNYVRIRDIASILNGTSAKFNVGWNNAVNLSMGVDYQPNGTEFTVPFSGNQPYTYATAPTLRDEWPIILSAIVLTDANGGGYTYYKLRDLGNSLGFNVDWSAEKGVFIETAE